MTKGLFEGFDVPGDTCAAAMILIDDLLREAMALEAKGYDRDQMVARLSDCFWRLSNNEIDREVRNVGHSPMVEVLIGPGLNNVYDNAEKVALWILDICDGRRQTTSKNIPMLRAAARKTATKDRAGSRNIPMPKSRASNKSKGTRR